MQADRQAAGRASGFTLMEMMIAVAVMAILVTIAYPSYTQYVLKTRRTEALDALYSLQIAQEKWRATNPSYGTLANLGIAATTPSGRYTLAVTLPAAPGNQTNYTATATAVNGTGQEKDKAAGTSCAVLKVNQGGPVYDPAGQTKCWLR